MQRFVPIYQKIADDLQEAIANEDYPLGAKLPTEHELMKQLNVSRATVIAALDHLQRIGLVFRRPRAGTRVVSRFPMRSEIEGVVQNDWVQFGIEYIFVVDEKIWRPLPAIAGLEADDTEWLLLKGKRIDKASRSRICSVDLYVHPRFKSIEPKVTATPPRIYSLIEAEYGPQVRVLDQEMRAINLDAEQAERIGATPGEAAVQVIRWYRGAKDNLVEFTVDIHPGSRFSYKTRTYRGNIGSR